MEASGYYHPTFYRWKNGPYSIIIIAYDKEQAMGAVQKWLKYNHGITDYREFPKRDQVKIVRNVRQGLDVIAAV